MILTREILPSPQPIVFKHFGFPVVPPQISEFQFDDTVEKGAYVSLQCNVPVGDLPLQILWTHSSHLNQTDINNSGMRTGKLGPRTTVLIIESVSVHNLGIYTCSAISPAGTANYTAELKEVMGRKVSLHNRGLIFQQQYTLLHLICALTPTFPLPLL